MKNVGEQPGDVSVSICQPNGRKCPHPVRYDRPERWGRCGGAESLQNSEKTADIFDCNKHRRPGDRELPPRPESIKSGPRCTFTSSAGQYVKTGWICISLFYFLLRKLWKGKWLQKFKLREPPLERWFLGRVRHCCCDFRPSLSVCTRAGRPFPSSSTLGWRCSGAACDASGRSIRPGRREWTGWRRNRPASGCRTAAYAGSRAGWRAATAERPAGACRPAGRSGADLAIRSNAAGDPDRLGNAGRGWPLRVRSCPSARRFARRRRHRDRIGAVS